MITLALRITKFCLAFLLALFLGSCKVEVETPLFNSIKGSGKVIAETRNIQEEFDKIHVSSNIEVELEQSPNYQITVEADDNLIPYVLTEVEQGTLRIRFDKVSITNTKEVKVYVKMPNISGLKATSSSEIEAKSDIKSESLTVFLGSTAEIKLLDVRAKYVTVEATSSSDIQINQIYAFELNANITSTADFEAFVEADRINVKASSSSDVELKGKALDFFVEASSTATINARDLIANNITATASSSSTIKVFPVVSLKAQASSTGDIYYYNEPKSIDKNSSSAGSVRYKK